LKKAVTPATSAGDGKKAGERQREGGEKRERKGPPQPLLPTTALPDGGRGAAKGMPTKSPRARASPKAVEGGGGEGEEEEDDKWLEALAGGADDDEAADDDEEMSLEVRALVEGGGGLAGGLSCLQFTARLGRNGPPRWLVVGKREREVVWVLAVCVLWRGWHPLELHLPADCNPRFLFAIRSSKNLPAAAKRMRMTQLGIGGRG